MLRNTFCHLPGMTTFAERRLWEAGIRSWEQVLGGVKLPLPPDYAPQLAGHLEASRRELDNVNARYFAERMPAGESWRLYPEFRHSIAYIDIETTGLSAARGSEITTIALYDGKVIRHYVQGENLPQFGRDVSDYAMIVTYNGQTFDVPFIRQSLGVSMNQAHIDLRYLLKNLGYRGGLKGCEKALGLDRGELNGVDGFLAVQLWREYRRSGNPRVLETLLAYNIEDVMNLQTLLVKAYNLKIRSTPFAETHRLELPQQPPAPFAPDREIIGRLLQRPGRAGRFASGRW